MSNDLKNKGYIVIDDILSIEDQDLLLKNIFSNHKDQPGFLYTKNITPNYFKFNFKNLETQTVLSSTLIKPRIESIIKTSLKVEKMFITHGYYKIIENISKKLDWNLSPSDIIRAKLNLQFKSLTGNREHHNVPHVDIAFENNDDPISYYSLIYYVNDSDAYTYLFNKKIIYEEDYENTNTEEGIKVLKKIRSKKGRVLLFDGNILHTGSNPIKDEFRLVFNAVLKDAFK